MEKPVTVVTCTIRENKLDNVIENYQRQTYPNKELIIIINKDDIDITKYIEKTKHDKSIRVYKVYEDVSLGECLNISTFNSQYDYLTKFDDDDYYAPKHLLEIMEGFERSNNKLVGRQGYMIYFEESRKLIHLKGEKNRVSGSTLSWTKELWYEIKFRDIGRGEDTKFFKDCLDNGIRPYSLGPTNHIVIRCKDKEKHTWTDSDETIMSWTGAEEVLDNITLEEAIEKVIN